MSKRTWSQSNGSAHGVSVSPTAPEQQSSQPAAEIPLPAISRKVKACAACRKQKIKCIMDENGPPCRRCSERNLSCMLNKSLQTLIDERSKWKVTVSHDLENIHSAVNNILGTLSLPSLPALTTQNAESQTSTSIREIATREDKGPSCDNSPGPSLGDDDILSHIPIESLYQITRLRALRSDGNVHESEARGHLQTSHEVNDFITQGCVSKADADHLVSLYLGRIDHFMYTIGSAEYRDLESLRVASPLLLASMCTVAALHDPASNHLYPLCSREFRRLMAESMFERRMERDQIRAMCVGSYWLHDISWTLSCFAISRATEINLSRNYRKVLSEDCTEEHMDGLRMWYILYICDHHLSILYGRPSIIREDESITGWEALLKTPYFTESDNRLVSQVALLIIMSNIRELFGCDIGEPVPRAFGSQLTNFSRQIDQWMGYWTTELSSERFGYAFHHGLTKAELNSTIGAFPTKGVILHHYLAKLHLHSHVFRGLRGAQVPAHFQENAATAVSSATSVIEMLLSDPDVREGLLGIPHYIHSMIAFACVFLLKVASQYSSLYIENSVVFDLTTKVVHQLRSTTVGRHHLVHLMADGLEKMAISRSDFATAPARPPTVQNIDPNTVLTGQVDNLLSYTDGTGDGVYGHVAANGLFQGDPNFSTTPFLHFDSGSYEFDLPRANF